MRSYQNLSAVGIPEIPPLNNLFLGPIMALSLQLSFKMKTFGGGVKDHLKILRY